ncbi:MAG: hypothetical protein U9R51_00925 [Actinomycetota bacterium]|nr:hypothetical protein [Actinomycetota bacterium]
MAVDTDIRHVHWADVHRGEPHLHLSMGEVGSSIDPYRLAHFTSNTAQWRQALHDSADEGSATLFHGFDASTMQRVYRSCPRRLGTVPCRFTNRTVALCHA